MGVFDIAVPLGTEESRARLTLRSARPGDSALGASLLLEASRHMDLVFRDAGVTRRVARAAYRSPHTSISHARALLLEVDGRVAGQVIRFPGAEWPSLRAPTGYAMMRAAGFRRLLCLLFRGPVLERIMPPLSADVMFVMSIAVFPRFRGSGLGAVLLQRVLTEARASGLRAVALDVEGGNESAIRFYERHGFARRSEHRTPEARGVPPLWSLRLERDL